MTTLSEHLKSHSSETHDSLDKLVMSMKPFESQDNYKKFLQAQYAFHQSVLPVYQNTQLTAHFDDLSALSRFERVQADMKALDVEPAKLTTPTPTFDDQEAIGWFYCVEGSNVGAAILYKQAGKIELDDNHGASHLAAHSDGRMPHWRNTKAKIDALDLDDTAKQRAKKGADDAFAYFANVIKEVYDA